VEEALFDLSAEYRQMLDKGIRLSGEDQEFFIRGRLDSLQSRLPPDFMVRRILDFGCGIGTATSHLADRFPHAEVLGVDTSENALEYAREHYGSDRIRFRGLTELSQEHGFDLCYVNGVFHHIEPASRSGAIQSIHRALRSGGVLALFENNPWNPGTRMVMSRIPFDRDAVTLSLPETKGLVRSGGFTRPALGWSLFYFPRPLAFLRFSEGALSHLPLGAQYCVMAMK
jgi:SAM-dependent methyltransferase